MQLRPIDLVTELCEFCKRDIIKGGGIEVETYTCILRSSVVTDYPCLVRHQATCPLAFRYGD